MKISK